MKLEHSQIDEKTHVDEKITAYLDKELSTAGSHAVEQHCMTCPDCRRALEEQNAVRKLLTGDMGRDPLQSHQPLYPMWKSVRELLNKPERPQLKSTFTLGASAAVVAGVLIGLFLGSMKNPAQETEQWNLWSDVGSTMTGGSDETFPSFYLNTMDEEGNQ